MKKIVPLLLLVSLLAGCSQTKLTNETNNNKLSDTAVIKQVVSDGGDTPANTQMINPPIDEPEIGDLIIEKAVLTNFPDCYKELDKGIKCLSDRYFFDLYIKNIGTAPVYPLFYIENTLTDEDIENDKYPQANLTNSIEGGIKENRTQIYKHSVIIENLPPKKIKFRINYEHFIGDEKLTQQPEKDYENNTIITDILSVMNIQ